jgi:hypothetical protein
MRRKLRRDFTLPVIPYIHLVHSGCNARCWYPAIQTVGVEGARLAGGRSGETRGIGRGSGGVLRRVAAVS